MAETDSGRDDLAELLESGSREDIARGLAPAVAGMLARRMSSREGARAELPKALRAVLSSRRKFEGGSVRAWILKTFGERLGRPPGGRSYLPRPLGRGGPPEAAAREDLAELSEIPRAARGLLDRLPAEGREALSLLAVEGLSPREAAEVLGVPAAVVEQRAARAFAELAEKLASL